MSHVACISNLCQNCWVTACLYNSVYRPCHLHNKALSAVTNSEIITYHYISTLHLQ